MNLVRKMRRLPGAVREEWAAWSEALARLLPGYVGVRYRAGWYRRRGARIGAGVSVAWGVFVNGPDGLAIGDRTRVAQNVQMNARGGIEIGRDVLIGPGCKIWSANHRFDRLDVPIPEQGYTYDRVTIGDGAWLGAGAIVVPGVRVGAGAVVAAGSVVTRDVPDFAVVAGVPARVVSDRRAATRSATSG